METLQTQLQKSRRLRQVVMRRVWYAFALSIVLRPAIVFGFLFGASAVAFWRLASITSIIENLLRVQLGELPRYTATALTQADTWSLVAFLGLMVAGTIVLTRMVVGLLATNPWRLAR
ncbi:MAG: hypothetical protein MUF19_04500 [Candidatus Pacebacteria bacterium]|jgi:hypothetical protein|nr:hypothetical protein [Candidatus Paceibacterota bacterium]